MAAHSFRSVKTPAMTTSSSTSRLRSDNPQYEPRSAWQSITTGLPALYQFLRLLAR